MARQARRLAARPTASTASSRAPRSRRHAKTAADASQRRPYPRAMSRSPNSHQLRLRALPHAARMRRDEPFRQADKADWQAAANRIAGPAGWYSVAGTHADWGCKLIHFATAAEAEAMQRWIAESGIEMRPAPGPFTGAQLGVAGADATKV